LNNRVVYRHTKSALRSKRLVIGRHTYGLPILEEYEGSLAKVTIGNFCSIGPEVRIVTGGNHPTNWVSNYPFRIKMLGDRSYQDGMPYSNGDIEIGSAVWIWGHVTILSGVAIEHGAVIAADALVTRDVEPYAIYGGIPARSIRSRFDPSIVNRLLKTQWWTLDDSRIRDLIPLLSSEDVKTFLDSLEGNIS